jgi:hypothetical protein
MPKKAIITLVVFSLVALSAAKVDAKSHKINLKGLIVDSITDGDGTGGDTIVGHKNGITYIVIVTSKTKIARKNGTRIPFSRIYELNSLAIKGTTLNGTIINARKIKNNSLVKAVRVGTIAYISPEEDLGDGFIGSFMMQASDEITKEVLVYSNTKIYSGKHRINYSDLQLGDIISAQGFIDTSFTLLDIVDDTSKIKIKGHGAVPNLFPDTLKTQFKLVR